MFRVADEADQIILISPTKSEAKKGWFKSLKNHFRLMSKIAWFWGLILEVQIEEKKSKIY